MKEQFYFQSVPVPGILLYAGYFAIMGLFFQGCSGESGSRMNSTNSPAALDTTFGENRLKVKYAEGFQIRYRDSYRVLEIVNAFQDMTDTLEYVLVPRGGSIPDGFEDSRVIETPIRSMIATSTTHLGVLKMLESKNVLEGMAGSGYVYDNEIRERIESKEILTFKQGTFNKEEALVLNPDLVMISGGQVSQFDGFQLLIESGINVFVNSEWLETTPLGKAEWVKAVALLLGKEKLAKQRFREVEKAYHELREKVKNMGDKPLVINNIPYKGAWFVAGGNSYTARLFADAGANYPWSGNHSTGGLQLDFEVVYETGLKADIWLNPGTASTKEDILAKDSRFRDFKSFQNGQIFNHNRRVRSQGGNDFWESGAVHPEVVLADLVKIFHPEVLPEHELYYYRKIQ